LPGEEEAGRVPAAELLPHHLGHLPHADPDRRHARGGLGPHHVLHRLAVRERRPRGPLVRRLPDLGGRPAQDRARQRLAAFQLGVCSRSVGRRAWSAGGLVISRAPRISQAKVLATAQVPKRSMPSTGYSADMASFEDSPMTKNSATNASVPAQKNTIILRAMTRG